MQDTQAEEIKGQINTIQREISGMNLTLREILSLVQLEHWNRRLTKLETLVEQIMKKVA